MRRAAGSFTVDMYVYRSNRVERLFEELATVVSGPSADPLRGECIVVQSRGMAVWLSMRLAERFSVWAGGEFPFPRRFVQSTFSAVLGPRADSGEAFTRERLVWSVLALLPTLVEQPEFFELKRYLAGDTRGTARVQLCTRIADTLDQYVVFRPDLLLEWERGRGGGWQGILWRALVERLGTGHPAGLARDVFAALQAPRFDPAALPPRVCVFGLSTLPPFYLQVLDAVAKHVPVHLFAVSPTRAYWADVRKDDADAPPLLGSLGGVGREFARVLEDACDYQEPSADLYEDPGTHSLMRSLQNQILSFEPSPARPVRPDDSSISIHACHSPMREVEVLHDQLLALLADDPTLQPRDIVVMMSDVDTYAPLVEAVFEREPDDPTYIPYSVADRSIRGDSPTIEAFHRVLALAGARVTASEVLDLLALEPVQGRFGISPEDVDTITGWIADSGIRWGVDGAHRRAHGQPAFEENTWRFGLDRLLLGYALPGERRETFGGVLPYDELEGHGAALLGRLTELCERLFDLLTRLAQPRPLPQWHALLIELTDTMLAPSFAVEHLRAGLEQIAGDAAAAGFEDAVELEAVRGLLETRIEDDRPARGFLSGGVTLCAMLPMRSIPFRVVCLLGMGDTQFPRSSRRIGFDVIGQHPRQGDRSRRSDDRYLFLEAILAARDRVQLYHVGQSIQDNSPVPPSVVVSELVDALEDTHEARVPMRRFLEVRHPMQPFSPRYFSGEEPRLFSFNAAHCEGARAVVAPAGHVDHAPMFAARLPAFAAGQTLPLEHLVRFFRQPTAELLKRRLGVNLDDWSRDRSDREPMELDGLEEWRVGTELVAHRLEQLESQRSMELLRASGELPLGTPGECRFDEIATAVDPIVAATANLQRGPRLSNLDVDLSFGDTRIIGALTHRWGGGVVGFQYAKLGAKHLLAAWIRHLVLCVAAPDDQDARTTLVARADVGSSARVSEYRVASEAAAHLEDLVKLYWLGQAEPLLLFPRSSLAFCRSLAERRDLGSALEAARGQWSPRFNPERGDAQLRRVYGDDDVLTPSYSLFDGPMRGGDFPHLSVRVFEPLLRHLEES